MCIRDRVLRVNIADNGLSMSSLYLASNLPVLDPDWSLVLINDGVTLSNTASRIEHKKENAIDSTKKKISNPTYK